MSLLKQPAKTRTSNVAAPPVMRIFIAMASDPPDIVVAAAARSGRTKARPSSALTSSAEGLARFDENASAPGVQTGKNVANQVTHHPRRGKIQLQISRCTEQHARPWFTVWVFHHRAIIAAGSDRAVINTINRSTTGSELPVASRCESGRVDLR